jgi:hypothetical protein
MDFSWGWQSGEDETRGVKIMDFMLLEKKQGPLKRAIIGCR